jgi:hypothetical protein
VAGIIRDFWASRTARADVQIFPRRTPGPFSAAPAPVAGRAEAAVAAVFTGRALGGKGICSDCHRVSDTGSANITRRFAIAPVTLNNHYLPQGRFPHGQHRSFNAKTGDAACLSCHQGALSSRAASDVLVPGVANCRQCHGAPANSLFASAPRAADSCDTCHAYHDGVNPAAPLPAGPAARRVAARPERIG